MCRKTEIIRVDLKMQFPAAIFKFSKIISLGANHGGASRGKVSSVTHEET